MDAALGLNGLSLGATSGHIFPFFELARELRDGIYDECLHDRIYAVKQDEPEIVLQGVGLRHLLLVSHQFTTEYTSRTRDCGTLIISHKNFWAPKLFQIPHPLRWNIFDMKLDPFCQTPDEVRSHRQWIDNVLSQVQKPRSVSVRIVLMDHCDAHRVLAELHRESWGATSNLVELLVYEHDGCDGPLVTIYQQLHTMKLLAEWSKLSKKIERIEDTLRMPNQ